MIKSNTFPMTEDLNAQRQVLLVKWDEGEKTVLWHSLLVTYTLRIQPLSPLCFALQLKAALSVCVCVCFRAWEATFSEESTQFFNNFCLFNCKRTSILTKHTFTFTWWEHSCVCASQQWHSRTRVKVRLQEHSWNIKHDGGRRRREEVCTVFFYCS